MSKKHNDVDKHLVTLSDGRKIEVVPFDGLLENICSKTEEFRDHSGRGNEALYLAMSDLYYEYLLATKDPAHKDALNAWVRGRLEDKDFDIEKQPDENLFGKILKATILYVRPNSNEKVTDAIQTSKSQANHYSMALHWCHRNSMTPNEVLSALRDDGYYALRDKEIEARKGVKATSVQSDQETVASATKILTEHYGDGPTVAVDKDNTVSAGLQMFLTKVVDTEGKMTVQLLRQVTVPGPSIERVARDLAKELVLNESDAGIVPRLASLGKQFLGDPTKSELVIGNKYCYVKTKNKTTKPVKYIYCDHMDALEAIPDGKVVGLREAELNELVEYVKANPLAGNWEIVANEDKSLIDEGITTQNYVLRCDVAGTTKEFCLLLREEKDAPPPQFGWDKGKCEDFELTRNAWYSIADWVNEAIEADDEKTDENLSDVVLTISGSGVSASFLGNREVEPLIFESGVVGRTEPVENSPIEGGFSIATSVIPKLSSVYERTDTSTAIWDVGPGAVAVKFHIGPTLISVMLKITNYVKPKREKAAKKKGSKAKK